MNAVNCCVQLWCAAGVDISGWQQAESASSSSAHTVSSAGQSDDSNSAVCKLFLKKYVYSCLAFMLLNYYCMFVCSVNDFSATGGPIHAKVCMPAYSDSGCVFSPFGDWRPPAGGKGGK